MECYKCKKECLPLEGGKIIIYTRDNDKIIPHIYNKRYCTKCSEIEQKIQSEKYANMIEIALMVRCLKNHRKECELCRTRKGKLDEALTQHLIVLNEKLNIHDRTHPACNSECQPRKKIINDKYKEYVETRKHIKENYPVCEEIKMLNKGLPEFIKRDRRFKNGSNKRKGRPITKK